MKFSEGFWETRHGVSRMIARQAYDIETVDETLVITAPTRVVSRRGYTTDQPALTVTLSSPMDDVIAVKVEHHSGGPQPTGFEIDRNHAASVSTQTDLEGASLRSGSLTARITRGAPWNLTFEAGGKVLTKSGRNSLGYVQLSDDAHVDGQHPGATKDATSWPRESTYIHEQLTLGVGELVYGLGERFGPLVKNGQTVDIWNSDGGTWSELAYKNIPFYLTNRGYGVLVNRTGHVSYEVASESVERVQFSVPGESLEYFVIHGPSPRDILERYTALTGRPPAVPAWSYGLWLSTSFTTDYDEATVNSFIDTMAEKRIPLSVFHFDVFWMREFRLCDFEWDPRVFPDPEGMLRRLHEKGLRVCVWINPYIAQRSPLFAEASTAGFLVKRKDGTTFQWDRWQAGMGLVDFSNPAATLWFKDKLRALVRQGVDTFKTDFGERVPLDVRFDDDTDPASMHNHYSLLYNRAVFEVLEEERGTGEGIVFARAATVGGQSLPVHWGGDSTSSYESMAETLRGGLSLAYGGFCFWSHDIGGFEGTPDAGVFKRWTAFGLLSSHSRLHGNTSYRVPWLIDDEAVEVTRRFTELKMRLMPYLYSAGLESARCGTPVVRPMQFEFWEDPATEYLDRQYMLGGSLLVAPVFTASGEVEFYLPEGTWTHFLSGDVVVGPKWVKQTHGFDSVPLFAREGAVVPVGSGSDRPDYDYLDGLTLKAFPPTARHGDELLVDLEVTNPAGDTEIYFIHFDAGSIRATGPHTRAWSLQNGVTGEVVSSFNGRASLGSLVRKSEDLARG